MDTVLRIILLLCAYIGNTVTVTMELAATETCGQYYVTVPIPKECCVDQCAIYEPTGTVVATMRPMGIKFLTTTTTKLTATFTEDNGTTLFIKLGPVDKSVFSRQYVGDYGLNSSEGCPIHNYYIRDITSSTTTTVNTCTHVVDGERTIWKDTSVMVTQIVACPKSYIGNITRLCDKCGVWQTPVYNCTRKLFSDIINRFNNKTSKVTEAESDLYLDILAQETSDDNVRLYANDIFSVMDILAKIGEVTTFSKENFTSAESKNEKFITVTNSMLNENNAASWESLKERTDREQDNFVFQHEFRVELFVSYTVNITSGHQYLLQAEGKDIAEITARQSGSRCFKTWIGVKYGNNRSLFTNDRRFTRNYDTPYCLIDGQGVYPALEKKAKGADNLIRTVDIWTGKLSAVITDKATSIVQSKDNLYFQMENMGNVVGNVSFPNTNTADTMDWMKKSLNKVVMTKTNISNSSVPLLGTFVIAGLTNEVGKLPTGYSAIIYRNVSAILSPSLTNDVINSALMSFSVYPHTPQTFDPSVTLTLQIVDKKMLNRTPQCSFLDTSKRNGEFTGWSQEGCITMPYSHMDDVVVCTCDHLTNFALLMAPQNIEQITDHVDTLGYMSVAGCSISIVASCVTIGIYIAFWGKIRANRTIIVFNLFIMLVCAYTLFLTGVDKTANETGCTTISVLLHYFFSLVFLLMLAEGIDMCLMVMKPLMRKEYGLYFVVVSHVLGAVIVGITMAASQLKGYGNAKYCWLTVESGLVWVFLGEVILVITINSFIMGIVVKKVISSRSIGESKKEVEGKLWKAVRSICILMPIMGVTWLFGIFSINEDTLMFQYLFVICNSLQGVLICICHCILNEKVRKAFTEWRRRRNYNKKTESDMKQQATQELSLL